MIEIESIGKPELTTAELARLPRGWREGAYWSDSDCGTSGYWLLPPRSRRDLRPIMARVTPEGERRPAAEVRAELEAFARD